MLFGSISSGSHAVTQDLIHNIAQLIFSKWHTQIRTSSIVPLKKEVSTARLAAAIRNESVGEGHY
jgi:hypothetical protein